MINLSLVFDESQPRRASRRSSPPCATRAASGVVVVGASGNDSRRHRRLSRPRRRRDLGRRHDQDRLPGLVLEHRQPGSISSPPAAATTPILPDDPKCQTGLNTGLPIYQLTYPHDGQIRRFGYPDDFEGTSFAAPHVAATAALVIASGVLGAHPSPSSVLERLRATSHDLGPAGSDSDFGAGLLDAAAATAPRNRGPCPPGRTSKPSACATPASRPRAGSARPA